MRTGDDNDKTAGEDGEFSRLANSVLIVAGLLQLRDDHQTGNGKWCNQQHAPAHRLREADARERPDPAPLEPANVAEADDQTGKENDRQRNPPDRLTGRRNIS